MHLALARKYRPRAFSDLIGQEHVARALQGAVEQHRVAHGYLLSGPRGVGKTTAARILAMALNCETRHAGQPTAAPGEPCGRCASCERIWSGAASLDVVEIDAASNRGVDDARDLRERAMYAASQEGRHKVYIVDEAHMLTREAWNTLLKILEEPPARVVFVFATTEPHKITNTAAPVMSRLQRFDFRRVGPQAIAARLEQVAGAEGLPVEPDAVELIARVANGGLRDALSVLDQVTAFGTGPITAARVREVLGLVGDEVYGELLVLVANRRAADVFPFVARLVEAGVDLVAFSEGAGDLWRAALAIRLGARPDGVSTALAERIRSGLGDLAAGDLLRILRSLEEAEERIRRGGSPRLALETLLVRWAMLDRTVELGALLRGGRTGGGESGTREDRDGGSTGRGQGVGGLVAEAGPAAGGSSLPPSRSPALPPAGVAEPPPLPAPGSPPPASWPAVAQVLRDANKRIVAESVADTEMLALEAGVARLRPRGGSPLTPDAIERHRAAIEAAASRVFGMPVRVALEGESAAAEDAAAAGPLKAQRVTVSSAKAERTRALRGKDPALDSAMDAMDLELLD
jgi:DNA polymerase-3 subunit gamma/tau